MVKGHWSVLKWLYLLPYNRPRAKFLSYVNDFKLITKFSGAFEQLRLKLKKPSWWKQFVRSRKQCQPAASQCSYHTDEAMFFCTYPAWLQNRICLQVSCGRQAMHKLQRIENKSIPSTTVKYTVVMEALGYTYIMYFEPPMVHITSHVLSCNTNTKSYNINCLRRRNFVRLTRTV